MIGAPAASQQRPPVLVAELWATGTSALLFCPIGYGGPSKDRSCGRSRSHESRDLETPRRHIRPLRVASSMGLSDRVEREQNAIGATRWPRQYMSMADMADHAGKLDVEELSRLFGDNQLVDQVVRTDLDDEFS